MRSPVPVRFSVHVRNLVKRQESAASVRVGKTTLGHDRGSDLGWEAVVDSEEPIMGLFYGEVMTFDLEFRKGNADRNSQMITALCVKNGGKPIPCPTTRPGMLMLAVRQIPGCQLVLRSITNVPMSRYPSVVRWNRI